MRAVMQPTLPRRWARFVGALSGRGDGIAAQGLHREGGIKVLIRIVEQRSAGGGDERGWEHWRRGRVGIGLRQWHGERGHFLVRRGNGDALKVVSAVGRGELVDSKGDIDKAPLALCGSQYRAHAQVGHLQEEGRVGGGELARPGCPPPPMLGI